MDSALTFILLLRCCCVMSLPRGPSVSFSVVFSEGTLLLVDVSEEADALRHHQNKTTGVRPSVQVLTSVQLSQDPGAPRLLVCLLTGLESPQQTVLWGVDDTAVTSPHAEVFRMRSQGGGPYAAMLLWEVSAADWSSTSSYWCGTIQQGQMFRESARLTHCDSEVTGSSPGPGPGPGPGAGPAPSMCC